MGLEGVTTVRMANGTTFKQRPCDTRLLGGFEDRDGNQIRHFCKTGLGRVRYFNIGSPTQTNKTYKIAKTLSNKVTPYPAKPF
jgi:hypothetical protein